jgi:5-methylcytosine-specific restriction endonuclease McrA
MISTKKGKTYEEFYGKEKAKELILKNHLGHLGQKRTEESCKKQSKTIKEKGLQKGKNNSMYTTGIGYMNNKLKKEIKKCQICGVDSNILGYKKFHLHHKDKNRDNNLKNNLLVLCSKCHMQEHKKLGDRVGNNPIFIRKLKEQIKKCEECDKEEKLGAYFIDSNRKNFCRKNIKLLCTMCHRKKQWSKNESH